MRGSNLRIPLGDPADVRVHLRAFLLMGVVPKCFDPHVLVILKLSRLTGIPMKTVEDSI